MKKRISLLIVSVLALICLSGCENKIDNISKIGESVVNDLNEVAEDADEYISALTYNPRKEANDILEELLIALENNDNEAIKSMLAQDLINLNDDIDEEIQNAVDFFEGSVISYDYIGTPASGERYREGKLEYARLGSAYTESIITDIDTYRLSFATVIINQNKPSQEGIWRIWISKSDDESVKIGSDDYDL